MKKLIVFVFAVALLGSCRKNGVHKTFYDNGLLKEYAEYKDGELHGTVERYYEFKPNYKAITFSSPETGQTKTIADYIDGSLIREISYYENDNSGIIDKVSYYYNYKDPLQNSSYDGRPFDIRYDKYGLYDDIYAYTVIRGIKCRIWLQKLGARFSCWFSHFNQETDYFEEDSITDLYVPLEPGIAGLVNVGFNSSFFKSFDFNLIYLDSLYQEHQGKLNEEESYEEEYYEDEYYEDNTHSEEDDLYFQYSEAGYSDEDIQKIINGAPESDFVPLPEEDR